VALGAVCEIVADGITAYPFSMPARPPFDDPIE
jgi:hypothetical protein